MIATCVLGPSGRMGGQVVDQVCRQPDMKLVATVDAPNVSLRGTADVATDLRTGMERADVYIDFSTPEATAKAALAAARAQTAAVVGTTGLGIQSESALDALARVAPVLVAPNFSLGVALVTHLTELAARALGPDFDMEVLEIHHRNKRDAPSGTALALGQAMARGRGLDFAKAARTSRTGDVGPRPADEIGLFALRGGDVIGEHTAYFVADEERIELRHIAGKRSLFAAGAVRAARWLIKKPPGRYTMNHLLDSFLSSTSPGRS